MKTLTLVLFGLSLSSLALAAYSPPQVDAIIEVMGEGGFLRAKADQVRSDIQSLQGSYERYAKLFEKKAIPAIKVQEALWKLNKAKALIQSLDALVKIKDIDVEINTFVNPKASDLDPLFKARSKERLKAVQAEYLRAQADEKFFAFEFAGYEKLVPVGAISQEQYERSKYDLEGAKRAVLQLQKTVQEIEKLITND